MNIKRAWAALWREPEPVIVEKTVEVEKVVEKLTKEQVETLVGERIVNVYVATSRKHREQMAYWSYRANEPKPEPPEWEGTAYLTCAEAFAAHGEEADVKSEKAFIAGDYVYIISAAVRRPLARKPKVAKGRTK